MLWLALKLRRDPAHENPTLLVVTDRSGSRRPDHEDLPRLRLSQPRSRRGACASCETSSPAPVARRCSPPCRSSRRSGDVEPQDGESRARSTRVLSEAVEHLRADRRGPPDAIRRSGRQPADGAPQRCLLRLHRDTDRQERPQHSAHLRRLHRHLHHRASRSRTAPRCPFFYEGRLADCTSWAPPWTRSSTGSSPTDTPEEREAIRRKYATEKTIAESSRRIETIALDLIEHYSANIRPNG